MNHPIPQKESCQFLKYWQDSFFKVIPNFLILFFCFCSIVGLAQEQLGLRTENYSGINSISLNPANNLTSPFQWDVNLGAGGFFLENNFGGFRNASIGTLTDAREEDFFLATDFPSDQQFPNGAIVFDFAEVGKDKFATLLATISGPSFMLNFEKHSFGLFTNIRSVIGGQQIPAVFGYYDYQSVGINEQYTVSPSSIAGMTWSELGVNYLFKGETNNGQIGIGFSVKYLQGYESFFVKNDTELRITKMERDVLTFEDGANIRFGFTNSSIDEEELNFQNNGSGFGIDVGITFASDGYLDGYGYKLGVSLLDIGTINFTENTELHGRIDIDEAFIFNPRNLEGVTTLREGLSALDRELFNDTISTRSGDTYEMGLPSAFSLQADVALAENIYINATLLQRMTGRNISLARGNLLAVTPRYESRWISTFLPISLYNYQRFQIGAAIRLAFLTIGSENLGSFLGKRNLTGTDFYAAIKVNPFRLGWKGGGRRGKDVKCYQF
ncbi:MAG: DUF5723 family protein [Bacteroidota bacterium]